VRLPSLEKAENTDHFGTINTTSVLPANKDKDEPIVDESLI
jgi:hypothetical protein